MMTVGNSGVHNVILDAVHDVVSASDTMTNGRNSYDQVHRKFLLESEG